MTVPAGSPGEVASWASIDSVKSTTGVDVALEDILYAQSVIETYCGRTFEGSQVNDSIRPKDLVWLKKAVAYQAVWQVQQPGYYGRHSIKEVNQDGAQVIYAGSSEANNTSLVMLAPLSQRALRNVSWMRSRTIKIKPSSFRAHESYGDYKRNDDHPGWRPM